MPSAERYFLVGGLSHYADYEELDADAVTGEIQLMRETLAAVGYTEIEPPEGDRRGPRELVRVLRKWLKRLADDPTPRLHKPSLLVYYTGHGIIHNSGGRTLYLPESDAERDEDEVDRESYVEAFELAAKALNTHVLDDYLLILDTCRSSKGGLDIVARESARTNSGLEKPNLWIISAARDFESAQVSRFAAAFSTCLGKTKGHRAQVDIGEFVGLLNAELGPGGQQAELIGVAHSACGLLLDPQYMPTELPADLPSWTHYARGVAYQDTPGWFFGGRETTLTAINEHLASTQPGPLVIAGDRGSGRTSLLRWTQLSATPALWAAVPPIARQRAMHVMVDAPVEYLHVKDETPDVVLPVVADLLGVPSAEIAALTEQPPAACLLVDLAPTEPPHQETLAYLSALASIPTLRVVLAGPHASVASLPAARTVDLGTAEPSTSAELLDYLTFRVAKDPRSSRPGELNARLIELADACCDSFDAAARAAEELVRTAEVSKALDQAANVLTNHCVEAMKPAGSRAWAVAMLRPFVFGRPLTEAQWAALASALSTTSPGVDDVRFARERLSLYLAHDAPTGTWALRFTPYGSDYEVDPGMLRTALIEMVPTVDGARQWHRAEPVYLDLLAEHATGPGAALLEDPAFLLTIPSASAEASLERQGDRELLGAWRQVRHSGAPLASRSAALALRAYASGRADLARRFTVAGLPFRVRWRHGPSDLDLARLAVDGFEAAFAATADADGALTVWETDSGQQVYRLPADDSGAVTGLGMSVVDGNPVVVAARWTGEVIMWHPAACMLSLVATDAADVLDVAVDADYRVAVVDGRRLRIIDGRDGSALAEPVPLPDAAAVRITPGTTSVATMAGELQVWPDNRPTPYVYGGFPDGLTPTLGLCGDGTGTVWAARGRIWTERPGTPQTSLGQLQEVTHVAISDRWVAAVNVRDRDSVRIWQLRTGQFWDIPLDDLGVGAAFPAPDVLLVAMPSGLACFHLGPSVTPAGRDTTS
jgi:hypothetical protein